MALTLAQLVEAKTPETVRDEILSAMKGLGYVKHVGTGTGTISITGIPDNDYEIIIKIVVSGELGGGVFRYSEDDGATYSGNVTIPGGGTYAIGTTGITATFTTGPSGSGTSFVEDDEYSFTLSVPSMPVTSWHEGGVARTIIEVDAQAVSDLTDVQVSLAQSGFLAYSSGSWLDLVAFYLYDLTRDPGVKARGTIRLTDAGSGPHTIVAGQLWVAASTGVRFTNIAGGTLNLNSTLDLTFEAEAVGVDYNVANNTITTMQVSLAGVTCNNPPGSGTWLTTNGTDIESDVDLRARCSARWPASGVGSNDDAIILWAKAASNEVTRVDPNPNGTTPGQIDVLIAGASGGVSGTVVSAVQDYLEIRIPDTSSVLVTSAIAHAITVDGTYYVAAAYAAAADALIQTNISRLFRETAIAGTVYRTALIEEIMTVPGLRNVDLAGFLPAADVVLAANEVPTLTYSLTGVSV